ncbi:MAG: hypothetical protein M1824_001536 [Vezdaea acicularis]|nr:MAG: hypothetical protein M1824_001536 [Vezdaea acicularis]
MSTAASQRPVRLLSLDGGGVRGLSEIMILQHLMEAMNRCRGEKEELHPWQVFDMIGGTSTGGIIAIMLGRLRMSLEDCETAYLTLSRKIFTPKRRKRNLFGKGKDFLNADGKFDARVVEQEIIKLLKDLPDCDEDTLLKDSESKCRVFVVTTRQTNSEPAILRSYKNSEGVPVVFDECKVWEACRATSAAPTFFDPIQIGKYGQVFADGGMLYNNPVQLTHREASNIWPGRGQLLISIGTGSAPGKSLKGNLKTVIDRMQEIVTETEQTANDFYHDHNDMVENHLYYRFNVTNGLADIGLEEYREIRAMADATQTYLDNGEISKRFDSCANILAKEHQPIVLQSTSERQDQELEQQRIIEWLSPLNFFKTQIDVSQKRQDGTGQWLLESKEFVTWVSTPGDILWCSGMPGAGKTVLAIGIAFIYFDYKEEAIQTPLNIVSSLLKQLLQNRVKLCSDLKPFCNRHWRQNTRPSLSEISKVLQNVLTSHDRVFVVIDALDECPEKDGIRATFLRWLKDLVKNMSMVVLSRPNVHIDQEFKGVTRLEIRATEEDIVTYLEDRIQHNVSLQRSIKKDPHLKSLIIETITEKSQGM